MACSQHDWMKKWVVSCCPVKWALVSVGPRSHCVDVRADPQPSRRRVGVESFTLHWPLSRLLLAYQLEVLMLRHRPSARAVVVTALTAVIASVLAAVGPPVLAAWWPV